MKTDSGSSEQGRSQLDTHVCSFDSNVARLVQLLISGGIVLKARAPLSIKLLLVQSCPLHMLPPAACLAWILSNEPRLEIKWTLLKNLICLNYCCTLSHLHSFRSLLTGVCQDLPVTTFAALQRWFHVGLGPHFPC